MRSLQGRLSASDLDVIKTAVALRFTDPSKFRTPEALIVYEQSMLSEDELLEMVEDEYGMELEEPPVQYLPKELLVHFLDHDCVPIRLDTVKDQVHVIVIPELNKEYIPNYKGYQVVRHFVPIYYYVEVYRKAYRDPDFLRKLPAKDLFDMIVAEGVRLGAADITISEKIDHAEVYYNVKKRRVDSKRKIDKSDAKAITDLIATEASMTRMSKSKNPIYPSIDLDPNHRGRVVINTNYHGTMATMRVLPNKLFDTSLEDLRLSDNTIKFLREKFMSDEKGLRIFIGPTFSGKNTSAMSALYEKIKYKEYKTVSVEQPVELLVDCIEQINCETEEEFISNTASLLRQNPDIVYITEMTDRTAGMTMNISNTGKIVISSLHANSIADCIARIQDMTKLSVDRIVLNLQSAVYQELIPVGENDIKAINTCLHFSDELKEELIGKTIGEATLILKREEAKWVS